MHERAWLIVASGEVEVKQGGEGVPGGTGQTIDWELVRNQRLHAPIILSGGLTPDNVAAALHGCFVICPGPGEEPVRFDPAPGLEGVLAIPDHEVPTAEARAAMPAELPVAEAVHNVGHAALLVLGLAKDDFSLIGRGLRDQVHQPRRASLYPRSMELVDEATALGALGATISGAGPTVLVWTTWQDAGKVAEALEARCAGWAEVRRLPFCPHGADVPEL